MESGITLVVQLMSTFLKLGFTQQQTIHLLPRLHQWSKNSLSALIQIVDTWPVTEIVFWMGPLQTLFSSNDISKPCEELLERVIRMRETSTKNEQYKAAISNWAYDAVF